MASSGLTFDALFSAPLRGRQFVNNITLKSSNSISKILNSYTVVHKLLMRKPG